VSGIATKEQNKSVKGTGRKKKYQKKWRHIWGMEG
jgi:hypothetical protein